MRLLFIITFLPTSFISTFPIPIHCREEADKDEKLEVLEAQNISVMAVEFSTMMEIIASCENLTRENETVSNRVDSNVVNEEIGYWSLLRGIIPGMIRILNCYNIMLGLYHQELCGVG